VSTDRRFEQDLGDLLEELYLAPTPAYRDMVLQRTARIRQRPAWTFPGRWLPVVDLIPGPIPWRSVGLVALLAGLILAVAAAFIAGSQRRAPAPFGLARPGLVAYADGGDIHTVDPTTGISTSVVTGPEDDSAPQWSRDGSRLAFLRRADGQAGGIKLSMVYVVRPDGTDLRLVTPEPIPITGNYGFSPDGSALLLTVTRLGTHQVVVANVDGTGFRTLDVGVTDVAAGDAGPSWRPPGGDEILFADGALSLHVVGLETGAVRTIVGPADPFRRGTPKWSPDGSRIAYIEWMEVEGMTAQIHIIQSDGSDDRVLPLPPGAVWQAFRSWSNDGTRILAIRGYSPTYDEAVAAVIPANGSGTGTEIDYSPITPPVCCPEWEWAPDDRSILGIAPDRQGNPAIQMLLDPIAGTATAVPWTTSSLPAWQRLAP
jgi:Tol biopolymer transport system component